MLYWGIVSPNFLNEIESINLAIMISQNYIFQMTT